MSDQIEKQRENSIEKSGENQPKKVGITPPVVTVTPPEKPRKITRRGKIGALFSRSFLIATLLLMIIMPAFTYLLRGYVGEFDMMVDNVVNTTGSIEKVIPEYDHDPENPKLEGNEYFFTYQVADQFITSSCYAKDTGKHHATDYSKGVKIKYSKNFPEYGVLSEVPGCTGGEPFWFWSVLILLLAPGTFMVIELKNYKKRLAVLRTGGIITEFEVESSAMSGLGDDEGAPMYQFGLHYQLPDEEKPRMVTFRQSSEEIEREKLSILCDPGKPGGDLILGHQLSGIIVEEDLVDTKGSRMLYLAVPAGVVATSVIGYILG